VTSVLPANKTPIMAATAATAVVPVSSVSRDRGGASKAMAEHLRWERRRQAFDPSAMPTTVNGHANA
jgi:hypothetical protein